MGTTMTEQEFLQIVTDYFSTTIPEDSAKPLLTTKMVMLLQGLADDDDVHLYSWTSQDTFSWDALGMMETLKSDIHQAMHGDD